jgi:hypothetical protein
VLVLVLVLVLVTLLAPVLVSLKLLLLEAMAGRLQLHHHYIWTQKRTQVVARSD